MVRAILGGTKTQTRRLIDPQPPATRRGRPWASVEDLVASCPYGVPGDRLWVRETWHPAGRFGPNEVLIEYLADKSERVINPPAAFMWDKWRDEWMHSGWRPSIFMPRWSSRITLEITDVRVQRLQEISEEDAQAEGVTPYTGLGPDQRVPGPGFGGALLAEQPHRLPFADLWDSLNGKRSPWESNPWVWAITFRRLM